MMIARLALLTILGASPVTHVFAAPARERLSDDAMERAAEQLIDEERESGRERAATKASKAARAGTSAGATTAGNSAAESTSREDEEVPVVINEPARAKSGGNLIWRLLASIGVLAAAGVALHFFARRYAAGKALGGGATRIEMIHQYPLGPRKSLGLVRVAGEVMLVGITDHNINMIKTINMIDDDMAAAINQDFNGFLEDEFAVADPNHFGRRNQ